MAFLPLGSDFQKQTHLQSGVKRGRQGEANEGGDGEKSQGEEKCTVNQIRSGITNPEEMNACVTAKGTIPAEDAACLKLTYCLISEGQRPLSG